VASARGHKGEDLEQYKGKI
jgi:hypothetical protein